MLVERLTARQGEESMKDWSSAVTFTGLAAACLVGNARAQDKLYWIDEGAGIIMRSDLDGQNIQPVASGQAPVTVVADVCTQKIYYTYQAKAIYRADLDGQNPVCP
jgi:hypothetical protein